MVTDADKHLSWCFEKDQIEFDSPNEMLAEDYLNKAREALEVADLLEENLYYDWTITASYYARYFALTALLRRCGLVVDNHSCAITLFKYAFVEIEEMNNDLLKSIRKGKRNRVEKQYGITRTTDTTTEKQRKEAIEFVTEITGYLEGISQDTIDKVREKVKKLQ